ncbi:MAG: hypothetical protein H0U16_04480 [Actinobacteria bacterium]|nr:hypothetical protein [Actinomycetota bacterium]
MVGLWISELDQQALLETSESGVGILVYGLQLFRASFCCIANGQQGYLNPQMEALSKRLNRELNVIAAATRAKSKPTLIPYPRREGVVLGDEWR